MVCKACQKFLSDLESCRRNPSTGEFEELCGACLQIALFDIPNEDSPASWFDVSTNYSHHEGE